MDAPKSSPIVQTGSAAPVRIAVLCTGDRAMRAQATPADNRFADVCAALAALGAQAEPAVYHDDFCDEVRAQLMQVHGVLVWVNPIEGERDRGVLDAMLREVAAAGVFVSTHPDVILKLGTKQVLYDTRDIGWGCDTHVYRSLAQLREQLPARLGSGAARVLKQYRGNGGNGVWKVELVDAAASSVSDATPVRARHAKRGSVEETMSFGDFFNLCASYFERGGRMIDQAYQTRLPEGMVRCYLVHGEVAGFGLQAINALHPAPPGAPPEDAPKTTPRLYHPATLPQCQALKRQLEQDWVPALQRRLEIGTHELPVLWDCDFLLGPKDAAGQDSYVLCEINVSSVSPFPESALEVLARAALERAGAARQAGLDKK